MPHSSGGGSHGGGSHGGSHHSSGSSGSRSSAPLVRNSYFAGSLRYSYYDKNHIKQYIYCAKDPAKAFKPRWFFIIFYIPFIIAGIYMAKDIVHIPAKVLNADSYILIEDNAKVISDKSYLEAVLSDFYSKTGVTPAVMTVYHKDWRNNYTSLEEYAYDLYVNAFNDELHWLVVYSVPEQTSADGFVNWHWEGMLGNDVGCMITSKNEDFFTREMQRNLTASSRYTLSKAIADTFDATASQASKIEFDFSVLSGLLVMLAFVTFHAIFMIGLDPKSIRYSKAVYDPETNDTRTAAEPKVYTVDCSYCRSSFILGEHVNCPNCGAPLTVNTARENDPGHASMPEV